jgi:GAF domain-containing protein
MALSSLFSQRLDRVAFLAYFLGSVVPLVALTALAGQAGPTLVESASVSWTAIVLSLALLSLSSFFALRRIARQTQARMEQDHRRLLTLLNASTALACADDARDAAEAAVRHVAELTSVGAAFVFWMGPAGEVELLAETGSMAADDSLIEAARTAIAENRPEIRWPGCDNNGGREWTLPATAITPLGAGGHTQGALAMVRPPAAGRFGASDLDAVSTLAGLAAVAVSAASLREETKPEPACV